MAICRACSSEIIGTDRYCRNCGAPIAPLVAEFDDTRRINPSAPLQSSQPGTPDNTNPLYSPPYAAYSAPQAPAPLSRVALIARLLLRPNLVWALIIAMLFTIVGLGIGRFFSRPNRDWREQVEAREAQDEVDDVMTRHKYEEAVQNALGFKQGAFSSSDFPDARGIFVNSLMSDDSAAALAKIQAGDLLMELNDKTTRNDSELSQALDSLKTGDEVPVKVHREGATINLKITIADRSHPPFQPKMEPRDQGFLGIKDSTRRCCVPGTKKWGVEITELHLNGPAELYGLKLGDLITEFDGHPVKTPNEFNRRIRATTPRSRIRLTLYRDGAEQKIEMTIGRRW